MKEVWSKILISFLLAGLNKANILDLVAEILDTSRIVLIKTLIISHQDPIGAPCRGLTRPPRARPRPAGPPSGSPRTSAAPPASAGREGHSPVSIALTDLFKYIPNPIVLMIYLYKFCSPIYVLSSSNVVFQAWEKKFRRRSLCFRYLRIAL